jgi:hypothetical protein
MSLGTGRNAIKSDVAEKTLLTFGSADVKGDYSVVESTLTCDNLLEHAANPRVDSTSPNFLSVHIKTKKFAENLPTIWTVGPLSSKGRGAAFQSFDTTREAPFTFMMYLPSTNRRTTPSPLQFTLSSLSSEG